MRVLLIESDAGGGESVEALLTEAGHETVRCASAGADAFPCVAVSEGACPLDEETGAVVAVRSHPHPRPTPTEAGVSCALREGVPLVVTGTHDLSPFSEWTAETADADGEILDAVAAASVIAPPPVVDAARAEARRLLGDDADVKVTRDGDRLAIELIAPDTSDKLALGGVAVRVLGAARQAVRRAVTMDIGITDSNVDDGKL